MILNRILQDTGDDRLVVQLVELGKVPQLLKVSQPRTLLLFTRGTIVYRCKIKPLQLPKREPAHQWKRSSPAGPPAGRSENAGREVLLMGFRSPQSSFEDDNRELPGLSVRGPP